MTAVPYTLRVALETARLADILTRLPWSLSRGSGELPFYSALVAYERESALPETARGSTALCLLAYQAKPADPMSFVEHVLRSLPDIRAARYSPLDARNRAVAAEPLDVLLSRRHTVSLGVGVLPASAAPLQPTSSCKDPESISMLITYAEAANGEGLSPAAKDVLTTAVIAALDVLDRYPGFGEPKRCRVESVAPPVRLMQAGMGGAPHRRLPAILAEEMPDFAARAAARLLAGWRKDETLGLLVNAVRRTPITDLEPELVRQWRRDLAVLDPAVWSDPKRRQAVRRQVGIAQADEPNQRVTNAPLRPAM
jgi:hypothetical protein